jgi:phenylalanyl-tRNA synthetase beta subunit
MIKYTGLSRYPSTEQDITLKTKIDLNFDKLRDSLWDALKKITPQDIEFSLQCIGIYSSDKKFKNTTFRITFVSQERTLTDEIINKILDSASEDLSKKIGALRV